MFLLWSPPYTRTCFRDTQTQHPKRITKRYKTNTRECVLLLDTHRHSRHSRRGRVFPVVPSRSGGGAAPRRWTSFGAEVDASPGAREDGSGGVVAGVLPRRVADSSRSRCCGRAPGQRRAGRPRRRGRPLSLFVQGRRDGLAPPEGPAPGLPPPVTLARPRRSTASALRSPAAASDGYPVDVARSISRRVHDSREQVLRLCPWWAPRRALPSRHGRHPMRPRHNAAERRTSRPLRPAAVRRPVSRWPPLQGRHDALEEPLPDARRGLHRAAHAGGEGEGARVPRGRPRPASSPAVVNA